MADKCPKCEIDNSSDSKFCRECGTPLPPARMEAFSHTRTFVRPIHQLSAGSTFAGRYLIVEELGRGGMGVVYKAQDQKLQRTVALKFLPPEWTNDLSAKERFLREARAAAALDHPHICAVHEMDEAEGRVFISMALVEGESLKARLGRGRLKLDEAVEIGRQIAEGLHHAHIKGVVHRDIKSANIMVAENGRIKIMDFGLARIQGAALLTREGTTMGTVAYMSPEQARGEEVDQRTDIWSLGVVFYEMFGGRLPFRGDHDQTVIYAILNKPPRPISDLRPDIPAPLEQVIGKALEKNPDRRYGQVEAMLDDLASISEGTGPEALKTRRRRARRSKRRRAIGYARAAAFIILAALFIPGLFSPRSQGMDSIAVLPIENLTGDPQKEYFADGITDELIGHLSQVGELRVISRTSMMKYRGAKKPLPEIARELHVDAVLEGAVHQVGDRVRIRLELIDALPEERNLWGETFDRSAADVLVMVGEISRLVVGKMRLKLDPREETRLAGARRVNPEAYEAYLKGQFHYYKLTRQDLDSALRYFESALTKDPRYALAYAGIARVWAGFLQQGLVPAGEATPKAKAAAAQALELDASLADVHFTLGSIKIWMDWDWEAGESEYRRAIELNPNYPDPRAGYSHLLNILKRPNEAMPQIEKALELDPLNTLFRAFYAMNLMYARRYDEAIASLRDTLQTSPNDLLALSALRSAFHMKKMYAEAMDIWKASFAARSDREAEAALARGYAEGGYPGALKQAAETLAARSRTTFVSPWQIGTLYTRAGKNDEALAWLEKAYIAHDPNMPYLSADPIFDGLRNDPRFRDLLRRMKLPQ